MSERTRIPATETLVLMASARRCALCLGFNGDLTRKKGQLAHIDQDASNAEEKNLVYLCVDHHDEYDSTTSQAKGITEAELRGYKQRLINAIAKGDHLQSVSVQSAATAKEDAIRGHDEQLFRHGNDLLPETFLRELLDQLQSDDSYHLSQARRLDSFRSTFSETGNQFIDVDLSAKSRALIASIDALLLFQGTHFFVFPEHQATAADFKLCMYPELNVDRCRSGIPEQPARYEKFQSQLDDTVEAVHNAYIDYRLAVKRYLFL